MESDEDGSIVEDEEEEWSKPADGSTDGWLGGSTSHGPDGGKVKCGHSRVIVHIDIDCFYAQVEMIRNPSLRNKPLGIQQKYLLVTCNYAARDFGVTKLMGIKEAQEKCPNIVIVKGEDLTHYREMSYKITELLLKYSGLVERLGFDENYIDVTEMLDSSPWKDKQSDSPEGFIYGQHPGDESEAADKCECYRHLVVGSHIAAELRQALYGELGITCCAGIAHNKLLAKLVSGSNKPNKQTLLPAHLARTLVSGLDSVRRIPGIGWSTCKKLASLGISKVTDLQECAMGTLVAEFGTTTSQHMKELSEGIDSSPVTATGQPQTMSDEDSFKKCSDIKEVRDKIGELISSLLTRLLSDGRLPQTLRLTIRKFTLVNKYTSRESRQCPVPVHVFNKFSSERLSDVAEELVLLSMGLFSKMVDSHKPFHLTLLNVCFAKLESKASSGSTNISQFFSKIKKDTKAISEDGAIKPLNIVKRKSEAKGLQGWIVKQENLQGKLKLEDSPSRESMQPKKRLKTHSDSREDYFSHNESFGSQKIENKLPSGIDPTVFSALPQHLQQEILKHNMSVTNEEKQIKKTKNSFFGRNSIEKSECVAKNVIIDSQLAGSSCSPEPVTPGDCDVLSPGGSKVLSPGVGIIGEVRNIPEENVIVSVKNGSCEMNEDVIPPDIDRDTFKELPMDVQKEFILNWKAKKDWGSPHRHNTNMKKSPKAGNNIKNYFQKK